MQKVRKAILEDCDIIARIGKESFLWAHGKSASKTDIDNYVAKAYNAHEIEKELRNPLNIYHLIYLEHEVAGFSKLVLNTPNPNIKEPNIALLDRIYLSSAFHGKNLGNHLFDFNLTFSKTQNQKGIWLAVWTENHRAINFYQKNGFEIVDKYDYKISETHSNPNHIMFLPLE
jgi:ribosomal protein S18 acetylase RimI-like enzyme